MKRAFRERKLWTNEEIKKVGELYPDMECADIAKIMGCRLDQIYYIAYKNRFEKSLAYRQAMAAKKNFKIAGKKYVFAKGHTPINKGRKMEDYVPPESLARIQSSQFKKGKRNFNELEDGAITIREDKTKRPYKFIRIAKAKWKSYQVHVWEQAHGPIPPGHVIIFKNYDTLNCELSNLEMITKSENMLRNSIHNYPEDIKEAIYTLRKLKKKINGKEQNSRPA